MQTWMIALIVVAGALAFVAVAFVLWALLPVHFVLGRRKEIPLEKRIKLGYTAENFGVNSKWFGGVKDRTETLSLTAYDGVELSALLIKQPEHLGRVAVCCHGYGANQHSMQAQAKIFYDRGFDVIIPAMRGHKGSGGKVGMAWLDRFDLLRWIDKAVAVFGDGVKIALCGTSMGGSTVIAASGMTLPSQVKCVIDDCGFNSQFDEYAAVLAGGNTDKISTRTRISLYMVNLGVKLVHGYSLYDADIESFARNMTIPALFIHGEEDKYVPCALGRKLYEACASENKEFLSIVGAGHALSYAVDKQKYTDAFTAFIDKYIEGSAFIADSDELIVEEVKEEEKKETVQEVKEDEKNETPDEVKEEVKENGEDEDEKKESEEVKEEAPTEEEKKEESEQLAEENKTEE
ncbi:MAG: alpha/beta hydrolase [Clostridiales bacterium]|nr:alpha/beta hydrolase [Clostridiales bacterium]